MKGVWGRSELNLEKGSVRNNRSLFNNAVSSLIIVEVAILGHLVNETNCQKIIILERTIVPFKSDLSLFEGQWSVIKNLYKLLGGSPFCSLF